MKTGILFFLVLLAGQSGASEVHRPLGGCRNCHPRLPLGNSAAVLLDTVEAACSNCHTHSKQSHPLGIVPSMKVPLDMPLDRNGKLTCTTCHTFHTGYVDDKGNKRFFLRRPKGKIICQACHT